MKSRYLEKTYTFQGYEDILLKYLVERGINFLSHDEVPRVYHPKCRSQKYAPDFYLPDYNLMIDVKSERTFDLAKEKLLDKQISTFEDGYNFIYFVLNSRHIPNRELNAEYRKVFEDFLDKLISSQALWGRFNDYPVIRSTLQAIGGGSAVGPDTYLDCDIV